MTDFLDSDIRFIAQTVDPRLSFKIDILRGDSAFVESILDQESAKLFNRIMLNEKVMTTISPRLLFEILLRRAAVELKNQNYTMERTSRQAIPVFDAYEVSIFLQDKSVRRYLIDLLCSFTKVHSFTIRSRIRKGVWRRIRFSDMDIDSLVRLSQSADEKHRFGFYKRIADLCLFILGMFPEHVGIGGIYPVSSEVSVQYPQRFRRSSEDYEREGRLFYHMAARHQDAEMLGLTEVLLQLHDRFSLARKPLNYISDNYLKFSKGKLFPH